MAEAKRMSGRFVEENLLDVNNGAASEWENQILENCNMTQKKILWVDDDKELTLSLQPNLEKEGWQVKTALSAERGKSMAVADRPDLIIMDIIMGGEHGYEAIKDLLGNPQLSDVPVIVFSSLTRRWGETTASREDALLSDAAEFVDKSAGIDALVSTIHEYLGN